MATLEAQIKGQNDAHFFFFLKLTGNFKIEYCLTSNKYVYIYTFYH